jgi:hypothetical protein
MEKCKHKCGWFVAERVSFWLSPNGDLKLNHSRGNKIKLVAGCNSVGCDKIRNVYIKAGVVKLGKIKSGKCIKN